MSKRKRAQGKSNLHFQNSGYSEGGASVDKNTLKNWAPQHWSSKLDIDLNLPLLRNRASDLAVNSAIGAAAINAQVLGVLSSGLKLYPKPKFKELGLTAEGAREWSRQVKNEFDLWARDLHCDYSRRNNFYELQQIAFTSYLIDGDSFVLFRRRYATAENPYTLRLQVIEAQRVSNPLDRSGGEVFGISPIEMTGTRTGSRIVNGIEVDRNGRLLAIWVSSRIWNEPLTQEEKLKWRRVKIFGAETGCRNVLIISRDTRADQFRGVPFLAPVIESIKQVTRYSDAELTAAIIKSFFAIFFTQPVAVSYDLNDILPKDSDGQPVVDVENYKLGAGTLSALPRGVDVKAIDRSNAQSTFDSFVTTYIKQIGAALSIPYEVLLRNFQASYSASKAALQQAETSFRQARAAFVQDFCAPIYEMFLNEAVALGRIKAPGFFDDALKRYCWTNAEWRTEGNTLLDEEKEVSASILRVQAGLSTHEREAARMGSDFYENVESLSVENKLIEAVTPREETESKDGGKD